MHGGAIGQLAAGRPAARGAQRALGDHRLPFAPATTASMLPLRTIRTTPGSFRIGASSNDSSFASYTGGITMRACSMPGNSMSCT